MKLSEKNWANFGRWMMIIGGIVCISLAFYNQQDIVSWLLKIWGVSFGIYCIYIGLFK